MSATENAESRADTRHGGSTPSVLAEIASFGDSFIRFYGENAASSAELETKGREAESKDDGEGGLFPLIVAEQQRPLEQLAPSASLTQRMQFVQMLSKLQRHQLLSPLSALFQSATQEVFPGGLDGSAILDLISQYGQKIRGIDPSKAFHRWIDNIGRFAEEFQVLDHIGRGAYGVCFKCKHLIDDRVLAVKQTRFELAAVSKIFREVQTLAKCHHPNIVHYLSSWCELELTPQSNSHLDAESSSSSSSSSTFSSESSSNASSSLDLLHSEHDDSNDACSTEDTSSSWTSCSSSTEVFSSASSIHLGGSTRRSIRDRNMASQGRELALLTPPQLKLRCQLFISTEYCSGGSLKDYLEARKATLDVPKCFKIMVDMLSGLSYIHGQRILHRDLKPGNVLLAADGTAKLCDFGLAKIIPPSSGPIFDISSSPMGPSHFSLAACDPAGEHTADIGTRFYVAPELLSKNRPGQTSRKKLHYGFEVDMFSMGVVLVELFSPCDGLSEMAMVLEQARNERLPDRLATEFPEIGAWIRKMISHDPCARPNAADVLTHILPETTNPMIFHDLQQKLQHAHQTIEKLTAELSLLRASNILD